MLNRKGQGSLTVAIIASTLFATIVASATSWYLSVGNKVDAIDAKLEAVSIAMSEWQRLEHMSFDELEAKRDVFKTPWDVGDKYKVSVQLGEQGYFKDGVCHPKSGEYAAEDSTCFQNTIMTVYSKADDGSNSSELTTRTLPLASRDSFYNKKEIDKKITDIRQEMLNSSAHLSKNWRDDDDCTVIDLTAPFWYPKGECLDTNWGFGPYRCQRVSKGEYITKTVTVVNDCIYNNGGSDG